METTVWRNGFFHTLDPGLPLVQAILTGGGRILATGSEKEILQKAPAGSQIRDLRSRTVVPGFNDNHVHAVFAGDHALSPNLGGLDELQIVDHLKNHFPSPDPGVVLRAFNWDYPECPNPRKELLDEAFPRNPVVLGQFSGHAQWLNSKALEILGISSTSPDPIKGEVLRDSSGEPTGIVRDLGETALSRLRVRQNYYMPRELSRRLDLSLALFARSGLTSVQDNTWFAPQVRELARRAREGSLGTRFSLWSLGRLPWSAPTIDQAIAAHARNLSDWIRGGPVKFFVDGTFSTRNACLCDPWADSPESPPCPLYLDPEMALTKIARSGRRAAFHCIGDAGIKGLLDAAQRVWKKFPSMAGRRIRIEHAQLVRKSDIPRIADLGILVAAQPNALSSPHKDEKLLGSDRALGAYPYRSLLDAGVHLSFGSDIPGESGCDPLKAMVLATGRPGPERISVEEALRCYTEGSAHAEFAENEKGRLVPGMFADFTILSKDLYSLKDTRVLGTVTGGNIVWEAGEAEESGQTGGKDQDSGKTRVKA